MRFAATAGGPPAPCVSFPVPLGAPKRGPSGTAVADASPAKAGQQCRDPPAAQGPPEAPSELPSISIKGGPSERASSAVGALFAFKQQTETVCLLQQHRGTQTCESFIIDLQYPFRGGSPGGPSSAEGPPTSCSTNSSKQGCIGSPLGPPTHRSSSSESLGRAPSSGGPPWSPGLYNNSGHAAAAAPFLLPPRAASSSCSSNSSSSKAGETLGSLGETREGDPPVSFCDLLRQSLKKTLTRRIYCRGCAGSVDSNISIRVRLLLLLLSLAAAAAVACCCCCCRLLLLLLSLVASVSCCCCLCLRCCSPAFWLAI